MGAQPSHRPDPVSDPTGVIFLEMPRRAQLPLAWWERCRGCTPGLRYGSPPPCRAAPGSPVASRSDLQLSRGPCGHRSFGSCHKGSCQPSAGLQPTLAGPCTQRGEAGEGRGGCGAPGSMQGDQGGYWGPHHILPPRFARTALTPSRRAGAVRGVRRAGGLGMNFHQPKDLASSVIPHRGWDL